MNTHPSLQPARALPALLSLSLALLPAGCLDGGDEHSGAGDPQPLHDATPPSTADAQRPHAEGPCTRLDLAAQCPIGSQPRVITHGCVEGDTVADDAQQQAGLCTLVGECFFSCSFQNPCTCGIARITRDGITCMDCSEVAACGDALCDRGETPESCPEDCGPICVTGAERCQGSHRQVCNEQTRWHDLDCRADQQCEFEQGPTGAVETVCQTRISPSGGEFTGFGQRAEPPTGQSRQVRFAKPSPRPTGLNEILRFWDHAERLLAQKLNGLQRKALLVDLDGQSNAIETFLTWEVNDDITFGGGYGALPARWPTLIQLTRGEARSTVSVVHPGAQAQVGRLAFSSDGALLAGSFSVGTASSGEPEPLVALWSTADGQIERLLRFMDRPLVASRAPATALAFSENRAVLLEARPANTQGTPTDPLVIFWQLESGRYSHLISPQVGDVWHLLPSSEGEDRLIIIGETGQEAWAMRPSPRLLWRQTQRHVHAPHAALSPDGEVLALNKLSDTQTALIDVRDGQTLTTLGAAGPLDFHPDGHLLLIGGLLYGN